MDIATQQHNDRQKMLAVVVGWAILFLAAILAYWPGLTGPFVLDDFGVFAALGDRGGVTDWATAKAFVLGGNAGPTGRPLALLTFLIDANNWPAESFPFKRTNLVIHLANGALLGVVTSQIMQILQYERQRARWIVLLSVSCWLLHPFLVSTTLYAVQRMTQLASFFVFAGLAGYLYGRSFIAIDKTKAYVLMSFSIGACTLLAMISKENGILLPLLIGMVEITVVASQSQRLAALNRYWTFAFIIFPSAVVAGYLGLQFFKDDFFDVVSPRDFSVYERLLTQPRVLVEYLQHWFIPKLYTTGVFQDHFTKSTGLLSPITTLLSLLLHAAIISVSIARRRRWPILALAVLFFYSSHVLESTVINLELYFEHRNYLSAAFLFVPLIVLLQKKVSRQLFFVVTVGVLFVLGGFTRYSATVWSSIPSIVEASARKAPTSARAQVQYALLLFNAGHRDESLQVIDRAIDNIPGDRPLLLVNRARLLCKLGMLDASEYQDFSAVVSGLPYDSRLLNAYTSLVLDVAKKRCPDIETADMRPLFENMLRVPRNAVNRSLEYSHIKYLVGFVDAYSGNAARAVESFEESLQANPGAEIAMTMAGLLATNNYFEEALYMSELALSQLDANVRTTQPGARATEAEIRAFQTVVRDEMGKSQDVETSRPVP
jgi:tetratricopeptide (TPR) repeat protein